MLKVLVMLQEIPEAVNLMLVEMTHDEFQEVLPAHEQFLGCYSGPRGDATNSALCKMHFGLLGISYRETPALEDSDRDWMTEENVDFSWHDRFAGRITKIENAHTALKFDAFLNTGLAM